MWRSTYSSKTARVLACQSSIGVAVKTANDGRGKASRMLPGQAVGEVVLAKVGFIGDQNDIAPVGHEPVPYQSFADNNNHKANGR